MEKIYRIPRILICLAWVIIVGAFCMMTFLAYDSFWPPKLVKFDPELIPIAREFTKCQDPIQVFHPGDIVPLRFKGYKYTDDVPTIITKMVNDSKVELPEIHEAKEMGSFDAVALSRRVPREAHEGLFFFEITYVYDRNFLRKGEFYKVRTEPFRIEVKKESHDDKEDEALIRKILKEKSIKEKVKSK
jgi:hypothetical protein